MVKIKKIEIPTCWDCPFSKEGFIFKTHALCPVIHPGFWAEIDARKKDEKCPYKKGIVVTRCGKCPHAREDYGDYFCPKIRKNALVPVPTRGFHEDCPLDGYDCKNRKAYIEEDTK